MDYLDFLFGLKGAAITSDLHLFCVIPPTGVGWIFYFEDHETGRKSEHCVWWEKRETPDEFFDKLTKFGEEFKKNLKEG